jgi:hypothetical protein
MIGLRTAWRLRRERDWSGLASKPSLRGSKLFATGTVNEGNFKDDALDAADRQLPTS